MFDNRLLRLPRTSAPEDRDPILIFICNRRTCQRCRRTATSDPVPAALHSSGYIHYDTHLKPIVLQIFSLLPLLLHPLEAFQNRTEWFCGRRPGDLSQINQRLVDVEHAVQLLHGYLKELSTEISSLWIMRPRTSSKILFSTQFGHRIP